MIRSCRIAIYYRLLIYSNLIIGRNVLDENGFCILNGGRNDLFLAERYYFTFGLWHEPSVCRL